MFDYVYVDKSLILPFIEGQGFENDINYSENFFSFQTKSLDNFMTSFFIDKDGNFFYEKRNEIYVLPTEEQIKNKKTRFCFGEMKEISPPENITDNRNSYFEFYDYFITSDEKQRICILFEAHVKNGKLQEPLKLKSLERTCLQDENERATIWNERWKKVRSTWQWKVANVMRDVSWKIKRFFLPITQSYTNLEQKLRATAKDKFLNENNEDRIHNQTDHKEGGE